MPRTRNARLRWTAAAAGALLTTSLAVAPGSGAETMTVSPTGTLTVGLRGNGHGHGMSQYGARGAAIAGKSYAQILAFYYPGTTLTTRPGWPTIRVLLSGCHLTTTIWAYSNTVVTGVRGVLPTAGIRWYRLVADSGSGLTLQKVGWARGSRWTTVKSGLPDKAEFHRTNGYSMRLLFSDGSTSRYYGYLRAVRSSATGSAAGVRTVNRVSYQSYTQGVVPREMPAYWQRAATDAQAVAARSYGDYAVHHPMSAKYDICDTSQCQVYGGHIHYDVDGSVAWTDFPQAAADTTNKVLTYRGDPVFAQFAASDGGWSVAGGQPYLRAQADPYDDSASGDPYLSYTRTVSASSIARAFGLAKITKLAVTARDGHGTWGGRVLAGYVQGTDSAGHAKTVKATGFDLADAFGVGTTWLYLAKSG